jgi:hypothetical protein
VLVYVIDTYININVTTSQLLDYNNPQTCYGPGFDFMFLGYAWNTPESLPPWPPPLAVRHLPFINGGPVDQVIYINVLHQKSGPIDQSDQLINGAQQIIRMPTTDSVGGPWQFS